MTGEDLTEILASLRRAGAEPTAVEVKNGAGGVPKSLVETLVAFSNRDGGTIIVGVDEASGFAVVGLEATRAYRDGVIAVAATLSRLPSRSTPTSSRLRARWCS